MDKNLIKQLGDELYQAWNDVKPVQPLTDRYSDISIADAYQIQQQTIARRIEAGESVVGKKIGITSQAVMDMLKVDQPDFGYLLSNMVYAQGEAIPVS